MHKMVKSITPDPTEKQKERMCSLVGFPVLFHTPVFPASLGHTHGLLPCSGLVLFARHTIVNNNTAIPMMRFCLNTGRGESVEMLGSYDVHDLQLAATGDETLSLIDLSQCTDFLIPFNIAFHVCHRPQASVVRSIYMHRQCLY